MPRYNICHSLAYKAIKYLLWLDQNFYQLHSILQNLTLILTIMDIMIPEKTDVSHVGPTVSMMDTRPGGKGKPTMLACWNAKLHKIHHSVNFNRKDTLCLPIMMTTE